MLYVRYRLPSVESIILSDGEIHLFERITDSAIGDIVDGKAVVDGNSVPYYLIMNIEDGNVCAYNRALMSLGKCGAISVGDREIFWELDKNSMVSLPWIQKAMSEQYAQNRISEAPSELRFVYSTLEFK